MTTETPPDASADPASTATTPACVLCGHDRVEDLRQLGVAPVVVTVCDDRSSCVQRYPHRPH